MNKNKWIVLLPFLIFTSTAFTDDREERRFQQSQKNAVPTLDEEQSSGEKTIIRRYPDYTVEFVDIRNEPLELKDPRSQANFHNEKDPLYFVKQPAIFTSVQYYDTKDTYDVSFARNDILGRLFELGYNVKVPLPIYSKYKAKVYTERDTQTGLHFSAPPHDWEGTPNIQFELMAADVSCGEVTVERTLYPDGRQRDAFIYGTSYPLRNLLYGLINDAKVSVNAQSKYVEVSHKVHKIFEQWPSAFLILSGQNEIIETSKNTVTFQLPITNMELNEKMETLYKAYCSGNCKDSIIECFPDNNGSLEVGPYPIHKIVKL
ncbi:MAG: hypothetical protein HY072_04560 [Deltaproteobacteria bacterium]|nr:hypothetical protein [Deltaproteobacteria bacterium]